MHDWKVSMRWHWLSDLCSVEVRSALPCSLTQINLRLWPCVMPGAVASCMRQLLDRSCSRIVQQLLMRRLV